MRRMTGGMPKKGNIGSVVACVDPREIEDSVECRWIFNLAGKRR
jgi:hypothetical protein